MQTNKQTNNKQTHNIGLLFASFYRMTTVTNTTPFSSTTRKRTNKQNKQNKHMTTVTNTRQTISFLNMKRTNKQINKQTNKQNRSFVCYFLYNDDSYKHNANHFSSTTRKRTNPHKRDFGSFNYRIVYFLVCC
jgi:hypothetical protein